MAENTKAGRAADDYLTTLEEVKRQYEQYVEVSELYKLPIQKAVDEKRYQPPSLENPLTSNSIRTA